MARPPRQDSPDSWHHVFNRAIARRTLFEHAGDFRFFLAQIAKSVRRAEIEIHAYCLMGTHFHLLVRSRDGHLGTAMRRVQVAYSRYFNRTRKRDGPLVRGRFHSKPVKSLRYCRVLVGYFDRNPVSAGLVVDPATYPYGSAWHYSRGGGPPWLNRSWVEAQVGARLGLAAYRPERYRDVFGPAQDPAWVDFVDRRTRGVEVEDPLDDLVASSPGRVLAWMRRKAELADGTDPGMAVVPLEALDRVIDRSTSRAWTVGSGAAERSGWIVARVGLGRDLCSASLAELGKRTGLSHPSVSRIHRLHQQLVRTDPGYGENVEALARAALACWEAR